MKFDISKPSIQTNILVDSALAHKELGWKPKISLNKGIINSIKWYKKNYLN
jgi:nucleoside-diphosphate-sugar epimerase